MRVIPETPGDARDRLFRYIRPSESGCWVWRGLADRYGLIGCGGGKTVMAHRLSYAIHFGDIPPGMLIRHLCHVKGCVNPEHLAAGTQGENMDDQRDAGRPVGASKGRGKKRGRHVHATLPNDEYQALLTWAHGYGLSIPEALRVAADWAVRRSPSSAVVYRLLHPGIRRR